MHQALTSSSGCFRRNEHDGGDSPEHAVTDNDRGVNGSYNCDSGHSVPAPGFDHTALSRPIAVPHWLIACSDRCVPRVLYEGSHDVHGFTDQSNKTHASLPILRSNKGKLGAGFVKWSNGYIQATALIAEICSPDPGSRP